MKRCDLFPLIPGSVRPASPMGSNERVIYGRHSRTLAMGEGCSQVPRSQGGPGQGQDPQAPCISGAGCHWAGTSGDSWARAGRYPAPPPPSTLAGGLLRVLGSRHWAGELPGCLFHTCGRGPCVPAQNNSGAGPWGLILMEAQMSTGGRHSREDVTPCRGPWRKYGPVGAGQGEGEGLRSGFC